MANRAVGTVHIMKTGLKSARLLMEAAADRNFLATSKPVSLFFRLWMTSLKS